MSDANDPCKTIVGVQADKDEPRECGEPGIRIGAVVRCPKHWNQARNRIKTPDNQAARAYRDYRKDR